MKDIDSNQVAGYREREHTADWELEVWAPDLPRLLEQAARGMYKLTGVLLKCGPRHERIIELPVLDAESLIVDFLSELLYLVEEEGLAFDEFSLQISQDKLIAELTGPPLESLEKEIKAVTYHKLSVRKTDLGLQVNIVFDV
jgi:SHS2 domain-containing protein